MAPPLDLHGLDIADVHCHGWRAGELAARSPDAFLDRVTLMGTCLISSATDDDDLRRQIGRHTDSTIYAMALRRRLEAHLGSDGGATPLGVTRARRLDSDPAGYLAELWADAGLTELFVDDGYPLPSIPSAELAEAAAIPVNRVARLEPWIAKWSSQVADAAELEDAVRVAANAAVDEGAVAFKSIIAYRTGLDISDPSSSEVASAFRSWAEQSHREESAVAKPVRDRLLRALVEVAIDRDVPVHIHCGGGDPSIVLGHARPQDLYPLLAHCPRLRFVLIHGGWPWTEEAAYIASVLPNVWLDTSIMVGWASLAIDQKLEVLFGAAPTSQLMYGSDEASEPEVVWFSALVGRAAAARVLANAVERRWIDVAEAREVAAGYLAGNARRIHGLG
jgi:predicted TIM-barrel fold metal-dependent hydrolase